MRNYYIDGFTVWGVQHEINPNTFDLEAQRWPVSFHHGEKEANQEMAELNQKGHEYDYLFVEADRQYDP